MAAATHPLTHQPAPAAQLLGYRSLDRNSTSRAKARSAEPGSSLPPVAPPVPAFDWGAKSRARDPFRDAGVDGTARGAAAGRAFSTLQAT